MKPTRKQKRPGTRENVERWRQMLRMVDQAFTNYERGLVVLRRRVVANLKRNLRRVKRSTA